VAENIDVGKAIRYVLSGLQQQVMYQVRVYGYSRGGDGLQSSPTLEFVLGEPQNILLSVYTLHMSVMLYVIHRNNGSSNNSSSHIFSIVRSDFVGIFSERIM